MALIGRQLGVAGGWFKLRSLLTWVLWWFGVYSGLTSRLLFGVGLTLDGLGLGLELICVGCAAGKTVPVGLL